MRKKTREYGFVYRAFDRGDTPRIRRLDFYRGMRRSKYFNAWFGDIGEYCRVSNPWTHCVLPLPNMLFGIPQAREANTRMLVWMNSYGKRDDIQTMTLVNHRYDLNGYNDARVAVVNMQSVDSSFTRNAIALSYVVVPAVRFCD